MFGLLVMVVCACGSGGASKTGGGVGTSPISPTAASTPTGTTVEHELGVCGVTTFDST